MKAYNKVNIIPPTQSSDGEISDFPWYENIAFGIPMATTTIVVSRRYPVKTTPNGIGCRCLPALSCASPTLCEMSDGKVWGAEY